MYLNYYTIMFFSPIMLISSLLSLMVSSWFILWLFMEINMICFIYIISMDKLMKKSMLMNYFLIQSICSLIYLFSCISLSYYDNNIMIIPMLLVMMTKLGLPPFHSWYLMMMKNLNWINIYLLMVVTKIVPLVTMSSMLDLNNFKVYYSLLFSLLVTVVWAAMLGSMTNSVKMLMGYSSIIQISYMVLMLYINEEMLFWYCLVYALINLNLSIMFYMFNIKHLNDLYLMKMINNKYMYMLMLMVLSLAGIPPFFGFLMKWILIQSLFNASFLLVLAMIISSLISMYFYLRMIYSYMLMSYSSKKVNYIYFNYSYSNYSMFYLYMSWMVLVGLFMCEII